METREYEGFVRTRITELRIQKNVSEHRMSLDLDKSGSYIRSITSGMSMPSVRELFNIIRYFEITPGEFFAPLEREDTACAKLCNRIRMLDEDEMKKVNIFLDIIK